jgi:MYXO-CTERM domain-containing protein
MIRTKRGAWIGAAATLLLCSCASEGDAPERTGGSAIQPPSTSATTVVERDSAALGVVPLSVDDSGAPRLLRGVGTAAALPGLSHEQAAVQHIRRLAPLYTKGEPATDVAAVGVQSLENGASVVLMEQRIGGVPVHGGDVRVLLTKDNALASVAGTLERASIAKKAGFVKGAADALSAALGAEYKVAVAAGQMATKAPDAAGLVEVTTPPRSDLRVTDAHAKQVYVATDAGLEAAWRIEFYSRYDGGTDDALRYLIAADTGAVVRRVDLTAHETFIYRAYADATGERRPFDGPHESFNPHPTGTPDGSFPARVEANLVAVESLNSLHDPWLPPGAVDTAGNNVFAYTDRDGLNDIADGTTADTFAPTSAPGTFDYRYDQDLEPTANAEQINAATVQLFYVINWLHDWYYDSGFTETLRNGQVSNYGRGGVELDPILAEAQDDAEGGGSRNNANMATLSDGIPPRMQMFLWTGAAIERSLIVTPGNLSLRTGTAAFGPQNFDVTGELVLANDNTAPLATDACQPLVNDVVGKIVLVDRGNCSFKIKARTVETAGGIGILVANNVLAADPPGLGNDATVRGRILIPAAGILQADGVTLKTALTSGPVTVAMHLVSAVERDGDLDNSVIAHEWGHYLHHRLAFCESTQQCRGMSEGWADFVAIHLMLRPGDNPDGTYSVGTYDTLNAYNAIRRFPYSTDRTKNDLSFRHIQLGEPLPTHTPGQPGGDNNQFHNAGEIWSSMLWEAYGSLLDAHPYAVARRRMSNYIVAGLASAPPNATYTETRDAILGAISVLGPEDLTRVADAFARRGAGTCAVSPPASSVTLQGVVESSELSGRLALGALSLVDDVSSCDGDDGFLDPGEVGNLTFVVRNFGVEPLTDVVVTATSPTTGVTVGAPVTVASIAPFVDTTVTIPVQIGIDVVGGSGIEVAVSAVGTNGCSSTPLTATRTQVVGIDETITSRVDTVEAAETSWTIAGSSGVWLRTPTSATNSVWHGIDVGTVVDGQLVTPALEASATEPLTVSFGHRYQFEQDATANYDGAVIEFSTDDGGSWADIASLGVDPGYGGELSDCCNNPLAGRPALVGTSAGYPAFGAATLDFGTQLAGERVLLRFRIATDAGAGAAGWDLDNITVAGTDNTPFYERLIQDGTCQIAPTVSAGDDQTVASGAAVSLAGTASDGNGDALTVEWTQESGPAVTLTGADTLTPSFTAPTLTADTELVFELTANDGFQSISDTVTVTVLRTNGAPIVVAGDDQTVDPGAAVTVTGSATDPDDAVGTLTFAWTQQSGPEVALTGASTATVSFTAPSLAADSDIVLALEVTDPRGASGSDTVTIHVRRVNTAPVVDAGPAQSVASAAAVTLAGTATDPEGDPLTVSWTQTSGPSVTLTGPDTLTPTFTAPTVATDMELVFELTANDGRATASDTVTVTVLRTNAAPVVTVGDDQTVDPAAAVTVTGSATDADDATETLTYAWTQQSGPEVTLSGADTTTVSFTAPSPTTDSEVVLRLTATDPRGASGSDSVTIHVRRVNTAPVVDAGAAQSVTSGETVTLAGTATDADGDPLTTEWSLVSGPAVTLSDEGSLTPTFTAPVVTAATTIVLQLEATDGRANGTDQVEITVNPVAPPDAGVPDAGVPDAGTPDAGTPRPDAGGGGGDDDDGCGCSTSSPAAAGNLLLSLAAVLGFLARRRRR